MKIFVVKEIIKDKEVYSIVKFSCSEEEHVVETYSTYKEAEDRAKILNDEVKGQGILFYIERNEN
ncbi:hypothetical protein [Bacillus multifaciens]|uniref:hypothetical protein n=1 Tax=Bacillus multifaciens TaxID=3068506 RepID=UPI002741772E|nr:hypothetical protein [Bacillus sp. WLY-B-L8]MDP7979125.1 hypothetical protein [Bacillus sp. WLY-B-L8]